MKSYCGRYTVDKRYYEPHTSCMYEDAKGRKVKCRPIIKIYILHPCSKVGAIFLHPKPLYAVVDTGAALTVFTRESSDILGIDLRHCEEATFLTPFNDKTVCVGGLHHLDLYVCGKKVEKVPVVLPLDLGEDRRKYLQKYDTPVLQKNYSFSRYSPNENLLGTYGFIDKVLISLDSERMYLFRRKGSNISSSWFVKDILRPFWKTMLKLYAQLRI